MVQISNSETINIYPIQLILRCLVYMYFLKESNCSLCSIYDIYILWHQILQNHHYNAPTEFKTKIAVSEYINPYHAEFLK